jgi:hypothetical protein
LDFSTRHGKLSLQGSDLLEITMDNAGNGVHRAAFVNGSTLSGLLEGQTITVPIQLAPKLEVPREMIYKFSFAGEENLDGSSSHFVMNNGDEIYARLNTPGFKLASEFGATEIKPADIKSIRFSPSHLDRAMVLTTGGTVLRGQFEPKELNVQITSSTGLQISTALIALIEQGPGLPSDEILKKAELIIARLGAESYKDRQDATEELAKMGVGIMPVLKKHLKDSDPEVRQRIVSVLEKFGATADPATTEEPMLLQD